MLSFTLSADFLCLKYYLPSCLNMLCRSLIKMLDQQGSDLLWLHRRDGIRQMAPLPLYIWRVGQSKIVCFRVMANWWPALMEIKLADAPYNNSFFEVIETLVLLKSNRWHGHLLFFFSNSRQILTKSTETCETLCSVESAVVSSSQFHFM